ncbi:MAG: cation:proton antiporter [Planctomycetota bacterium]|jgi:NhaP-type Na+/H+ or K+/H+ antiporter
MLADSEAGAAATQLALVMALGVGAQWVAGRLRVPSILVLLVVGFAVGPLTEVFGQGKFVDPDQLFGPLLFPFVGLAVGTILLEGGLSLRRSELDEIGPGLWRLLSIGAAVTWGGAALAARWALGFDWPLAALLGALLVVTGPTVTLPLLNFVRPRGSIGALVKWEGIVNDPIGAVLAVLVFEWIRAGAGAGGQAVGSVLIGMTFAAALGVGLGVATAMGLAALLRRHAIPEALQSSVVLLVSLLAFAVSNQLRDESGLITVTVLGIWLTNQERIRLEHIVEFKENLRVVLIGTLFVLLAARLDLADFRELGPGSLVFTGLLIVLVRPLAVIASGTGLERREMAFLAMMAPRGIVAAAVSSLFAIELAALGIPRAEELAPVVFVVIVGTVVFYGLLAAPVARRLGIADPESRGLLLLGAHPFARALGGVLMREGIPVVLVDTNRAQVASARLEGLRAFNANILSEYADTRVPLDGIGRFLALTPNDEVNSLAVAHMAGRFERARLFQLAPEWLSDGEPSSEASRKRITSELQGRLLFAPGANFWDLDLRLSQGARIKVTPLTEDFGIQEFFRLHGESAIPLLRLTKSGALSVVALDADLDPRPGDRLVSLVTDGDDNPRTDP